MNHPENDEGIVIPPSLLDQSIASRKRQHEEQARELPEQRTQTSPIEGLDPSRRVFAPKPPGAALGKLAPRPGGILAPGVTNAGQGRDRSGNQVRQPHVADLRNTLPRAQEDER